MDEIAALTIGYTHSVAAYTFINISMTVVNVNYITIKVFLSGWMVCDIRVGVCLSVVVFYLVMMWRPTRRTRWVDAGLAGEGR